MKNEKLTMVYKITLFKAYFITHWFYINQFKPSFAFVTQKGIVALLALARARDEIICCPLGQQQSELC